MEHSLLDEKLLSCLEEVRFWLRILGREKLMEQLNTVLKRDRDRRIYQLTDGTRSSTEIAKEVGVSQPTIVNIWAKWRRVGLMRSVPDVKGRCAHVISLDVLGIKSANGNGEDDKDG